MIARPGVPRTSQRSRSILAGIDHALVFREADGRREECFPDDARHGTLLIRRYDNCDFRFYQNT